MNEFGECGGIKVGDIVRFVSSVRNHHKMRNLKGYGLWRVSGWRNDGVVALLDKIDEFGGKKGFTTEAGFRLLEVVERKGI